MSPIMNARIQAAFAAPASYDVLHVEHLRAAAYGFEAQAAARVYDAVDCMSRLLSQTAGSGPTWLSRATARLEIDATRRFERAAVDRFDRVLLTSESERGALLDLLASDAGGDLGGPRRNGAGAARVRALPNGVDLEYFAPAETRRDPATLIFVGRMGYHANLAGARVLIESIMARIWARRPEARLLIVGADPPASLRALASRAGDRVTVTGTVPDVRPHLARATVSVSPLPYAVGIQNKVLEAMATATPVVASRAASAGLAAEPGTDLLVEAEPERFAAAVLRLLDEQDLARRIGAAGRRYVAAHHDWRAMTARLEEIYLEAIAAEPAAAGERR
jgi:glycosyltransferase involved in cell wall biosynthesis